MEIVQVHHFDDNERYRVAEKLQEHYLKDHLEVLEELDYALFCEVLCPAAWAEKVFKKTDWNRVQTNPIFYPGGIEEQDKPVTFTVALPVDKVKDVINMCMGWKKKGIR